jgi:hypothetical protein
MTGILTRSRALLRPGPFVLGLALPTGGCASSTSSPASCDALSNSYENNNTVTQADWDRASRDMDTIGDGAVTRDEFNAAVGGMGGGFGGGGRR